MMDGACHSRVRADVGPADMAAAMMLGRRQTGRGEKREKRDAEHGAPRSESDMALTLYHVAPARHQDIGSEMILVSG